MLRDELKKKHVIFSDIVTNDGRGQDEITLLGAAKIVTS